MTRRRIAAVIALAALIAVPERALAWTPKDNKCSICPSCCAPPPPPATPPSGGGGSGSIFPTPSRDPQRLAEMQRHEKAAEDAWNRGDADESERRLQGALNMADNAGDRARIQSGLDRVRAFQAAERERKAREERDRQRAKAESDFDANVEDVLKGFKGDFDGTGTAPQPDRDGSAVNAPPSAEEPVVDPRYEPPPLPKEPPAAVAAPQPAPSSPAPPPQPPSKGLHTVPPPRPMISAIPPSHETRRNIENALGEANGNPVDAQYALGFRSLKAFPDGDPQSVQEELSYLAGLARSYVGRGGHSVVSPDIDPTQKVRQQLEDARGNRDADALRHSAEIRDKWQTRRNAWIASGTKASRDGSLEGAVEVLAEQYKQTRNPDILNAIRYMEGGRGYGSTPSR